VNFVPSNDLERVAAAINKKTKALYAESIGNPKLNVANLFAKNAIFVLTR
jgi:O-acetylhomoserine (thiol)-lyase